MTAYEMMQVEDRLKVRIREMGCWPLGVPASRDAEWVSIGDKLSEWGVGYTGIQNVSTLATHGVLWLLRREIVRGKELAGIMECIARGITESQREASC